MLHNSQILQLSWNEKIRHLFFCGWLNMLKCRTTFFWWPQIWLELVLFSAPIFGNSSEAYSLLQYFYFSALIHQFYSMSQSAIVTTRRVLERLVVSYFSQRMAWKLLKGIYGFFAFFYCYLDSNIPMFKNQVFGMVLSLEFAFSEHFVFSWEWRVKYSYNRILFGVSNVTYEWFGLEWRVQVTWLRMKRQVFINHKFHIQCWMSEMNNLSCNKESR